MKIPVDYFLYIIKKFLDDVGLKDVSKTLKTHFEIPEKEFDKLMGEMKDTTSLKEIFKFYCKGHPGIKKFWKKKGSELMEKFNLEQVNKSDEDDEEEDVKPAKKSDPIVTKKTNGVSSSNGSNGSHLLNKKTKRDESSDEEESESEPEDVKPKKTQALQKSTPAPKLNDANLSVDKKPFKRIDDSLKEILPASLKDNSYESFMHKTGDDYGKHANEKLKFTKGRDFKKEKTKFKNKTAFGGINISTQVRSIKLDEDSD